MWLLHRPVLAPSDLGWGDGCTNYPEDIRARIWATLELFVAWFSRTPQSAGHDWWMGVNVPVNQRSVTAAEDDVVGVGGGSYSRGFVSVRSARPCDVSLHSHRLGASFSASKWPADTA